MVEPRLRVEAGRPALPRRERLAILAALFATAALAWLYLVAMARAMPAYEDMRSEAMLGVHAWSWPQAGMMFVMWVVMMVGMMLPSAAPMALLYAAVARKAARQGSPLAPTALFVAGYLAIWTLFSAGATELQWALDRAALLSPMMVSSSPALGAGLLVAAGLWQLTPMKNSCLEHCRAPVQFFARHWRAGRTGAFRMGLSHGASCLGCCWVLMGLLFLGGVMNLVWIAAITLFVLFEKLAPAGARTARLAGAAMIALGAAGLAGWWRAVV
jgi:predicted metal-binding membrane protein